VKIPDREKQDLPLVRIGTGSTATFGKSPRCYACHCHTLHRSARANADRIQGTGRCWQNRLWYQRMVIKCPQPDRPAASSLIALPVCPALRLLLATRREVKWPFH
jgi:hypothetical protein